MMPRPGMARISGKGRLFRGNSPGRHGPDRCLRGGFEYQQRQARPAPRSKTSHGGFARAAVRPCFGLGNCASWRRGALEKCALAENPVLAVVLPTTTAADNVLIENAPHCVRQRNPNCGNILSNTPAPSPYGAGAHRRMRMRARCCSCWRTSLGVSRGMPLFTALHVLAAGARGCAGWPEKLR